jgi:flavin reductase (DIM6/NTAB) family NADH-FMN oxidoreductase RutF
MLNINTSDISPLELQGYLQSAIAPRPICLASTIDKEGQVNLSPFSYFNLFSMNPPICIFSPSRRVRDNTTKHTLENIKLVPECVINIVNYDMVQQVSLASCDYPKGTNEFIKSGFTQLASELVGPPRVAESPIQLECIVQEVISLGEKAGAGNLVLAEIKRIHIQDDVLDVNGNIDQVKLDLVARLGGDWYARITSDNLFKVEKPNSKLGIGFDHLPKEILENNLLTSNEKAQLANVSMLPNLEGIPNSKVLSIDTLKAIKSALDNNDTDLAWKIIQTSI